MVRVILTQSADELADRAGDLLASRIEHNILATVLENARRGVLSGAAHFAYVEGEEGVVTAAALRTPPRRMLASTMDAATADALMGAWLDGDPELPGVGAPRAVAQSLARAWEQRTGGRTTLAVAEALHTLDRVRDPVRPASGRLRTATADDREFLVQWMRAFSLEAGLEDGPEAEHMVERAVRSGRLYVWEDGEPAAMVGTNPPVAQVVRIGPVYTPPGRRSRGYASSAVAAVSRAALAGGARQCMLYTDLANPTSNRIYAALGYRRAADWEEHAFTREAQSAESATQLTSCV